MPKRILILTNRIPFPLKDGGALAMDAMVNGYKKSGWQVFLLAMNTSRHQVNENQLGGLYKDLDGFETVAVDNRIHYIPVLKNLLFSKLPEHADRFHTPAFTRQLKKIIDVFLPDIIQIESIFLNTYLDTIRNHSKGVVVQRLHNIEYQVWQRLAAESTNPIKKRYLKSLASRVRHFEQDAWRDADALLPITNEDAMVITNTGCHTKMHVTPFGIAPAKLNIVSNNEKWTGYHIGAMDWMPNIEAMSWFINDVWPAIHVQNPQFMFSFAGRDMSDYLQKNLPEGITCAGEVADAKEFVADKKILIVPLRSGSGIRVKTLEAMAAGKLVISTTVGMQGIDAVPEIHYLRADNPEEFANAIAWALGHRPEAEEITVNARQMVRNNYNQDLIMESLSDFMKKILAERNNQD